MPDFYLGEITQIIMDEYYTAFYKLDGRAGLNENELINAMAIALRTYPKIMMLSRIWAQAI